MTRETLIIKYGAELSLIQNQITTTGELKEPLQSSINELVSPISQLDETIAQVTVNINKKIYDISILSGIANSCGCGTTSSFYYYEQAKAHRINAESTSYSGTNPYSPLDGTDGSTAFTSGIGSTSVVVGADKSSILELIINTPGSGFISSTYYGKVLNGGGGNGAKADVTVSAGGTVSSVIVNNGGSGYSVNDVLTIATLSGASFKVTDVGSPILGTGVDTYIVASVGIGSTEIYEISSTETSSCPISCSTYASQIITLRSELNTLKSQRDGIIVGSNSLKVETKRSYTQRYGYIFAEGDLNSRKGEIDNIKSVLNNSTYNQYFS